MTHRMMLIPALGHQIFPSIEEDGIFRTGSFFLILVALHRWEYRGLNLFEGIERVSNVVLRYLSIRPQPTFASQAL